MPTPITIAQLRAYRGPNIHGPLPGALLRITSAADRARRLRAAVRDGAQAIGLVIAYLEAESRPLGDGFLLEARFSTDEPEIGAELCRYIVAGMRAEAAGDEEWDRDGPLYALQARRRREALPVPALQLLAEARRRGLPAMRLPDGRLQIGYGARGWAYDPRSDTAPAPPWGRLGAIPVTLITGDALRAAAVALAAAAIAAAGVAARAEDGLGFDAARSLLADPAVEAAVIGLDTDSLLLHGLPVDRCDQAEICDMGGPRPGSAADDEEWLRALGLPMLLAPGPVRLNLADQRLSALIPYAPNGVIGEGSGEGEALP
ncbi:DUF4938 domain-containing protein [Oscillochloris sp. ZM17-4]|uniref:DUF4938 domain-containing protein n=1 Tax=Oscillochloris sp. ZM17-4 TaxID=2866714 RepID=UPI001C737520|nr:DUF4938 domain-containing protein [Oscillochloris sp. ZM17-4]MBX0327456.1 DUF4938 domain-containing protein [Oscillochloris sp. ZM17-4]